MNRDSLSVGMARALDAWALRQRVDRSPWEQIMEHARAHGVSGTGLYRALLRAKLVQAKGARPTDPGTGTERQPI